MPLQLPAVRAVSPHGKAGKKVPVTVETIESFFTGTGHGTSAARSGQRCCARSGDCQHTAGSGCAASASSLHRLSL